MAKIYERSCLRTYLLEKRRDSYDPQRVNLLGEDSICMVNLLVIPQKIVVVFYLFIYLFAMFIQAIQFSNAGLNGGLFTY